jgi:hypothetical protein
VKNLHTPFCALVAGELVRRIAREAEATLEALA